MACGCFSRAWVIYRTQDWHTIAARLHHAGYPENDVGMNRTLHDPVLMRCGIQGLLVEIARPPACNRMHELEECLARGWWCALDRI